MVYYFVAAALHMQGLPPHVPSRCYGCVVTHPACQPYINAALVMMKELIKLGTTKQTHFHCYDGSLSAMPLRGQDLMLACSDPPHADHVVKTSVCMATIKHPLL